MILGLGLLATIVIGGCDGRGPASATATPPSEGTSPAPSSAATQRASTPRPTAAGVLPASGREVPGGTYTWTEFTPHVQIAVPAGWQVGHRHPEFFDFFPVDVGEGEGPGVGFGRFDAVHGADGPVPMSDAAAAVAALKANPAIEVEDVGPASLAGRSGLIVDIHVTAAQTPVFDGRSGTFHLDPGWIGRCQLLDIDGGVLEVVVLSPEAGFVEDLALAEPLLAGFQLAP